LIIEAVAMRAGALLVSPKVHPRALSQVKEVEVTEGLHGWRHRLRQVRDLLFPPLEPRLALFSDKQVEAAAAVVLIIAVATDAQVLSKELPRDQGYQQRL
jgi:hypothetical protein